MSGAVAMLVLKGCEAIDREFYTAKLCTLS